MKQSGRVMTNNHVIGKDIGREKLRPYFKRYAWRARRFTNAIERSLNVENWYSALALALALPDICANVCSPNEGSQRRYVKWYNQYMLSKYTSHVGADRTEHVFLKGEDCYALRCALLTHYIVKECLMN
jgi:hypothetical protein